jgi:hypothetical protein
MLAEKPICVSAAELEALYEAVRAARVLPPGMLDRIRSVRFAAAECSHAFRRARAARMQFNSGLGDTDRMIPHFVPLWANPKKALSEKTNSCYRLWIDPIPLAGRGAGA